MKVENRDSETVRWTIAEISDAVAGNLLFGDGACSFRGISIDSRNIPGDHLFVAIKGEVHDGHSFAENVVEQGIRGLIIARDRADDFPLTEWKEKGVVCIAVNDTTRALGDIAGFHRRRTDISVVALTGSNGKTTTRKMTAGVVSRRFTTLSTKGNFNNEIGLPLTLLGMNQSYKWAILELGMNGPGEIRRLGEICLPDVGLITNIGPAHIGKLGSMEAIMNAKGELLEKIRPGGTAILNADDPRILKLAGMSTRYRNIKNLLLFGSSGDAAVRASSVKEGDTGISFVLTLPGEDDIPVNLGTPGSFMVSNALAAASVGHVLGLSGQEIRAGLEDFRPVQGRMNILTTGDNINIIDDTYNANPGSMESAIMTLRSLKGAGRGIIVIGDMLELGEYAAAMHRKIGSLASGSGIAKLYAAGEFADAVADGARDGMDSRDILTGTKPEITEDLKNSLRPGDWVLVKGSRGMKMEEIVQSLKRDA
ncbi:UDP-N-acetylmuramoyl-tripeptide--D-alanyl-D-alanine ligase [Desulfococcaceae bacterium HSG8]|nr:UDP-N-acetylmuramoyl-tripeptide--D-alanyl-D-alanine ligase [Desulfococcaceae bacterium HSG8]